MRNEKCSNIAVREALHDQFRPRWETENAIVQLIKILCEDQGGVVSSESDHRWNRDASEPKASSRVGEMSLSLADASNRPYRGDNNNRGLGRVHCTKPLRFVVQHKVRSRLRSTHCQPALAAANAITGLIWLRDATFITFLAAGGWSTAAMRAANLASNLQDDQGCWSALLSLILYLRELKLGGRMYE